MLLKKYSILSMALQPFVGPWPLFQFHNLGRVGRTPWTGDQPVARPLSTHRTTQTRNKRTQISMNRVGFEPKTPVFQRAKKIYALDPCFSIAGPWPGTGPSSSKKQFTGPQSHKG
jgi:hypothetical protein